MKNDDLDCEKVLQKSSDENAINGNKSKENDDSYEIENELDAILNNVQNEIENLENVKQQLNSFKNNKLRRRIVQSREDKIKEENIYSKSQKINPPNLNTDEPSNQDKPHTNENIIKLNGQDIDLSALTKLLSLSQNTISTKLKEKYKLEVEPIENTLKTERKTKANETKYKNEDKVLSDLLKFSQLANKSKKVKEKVGGQPKMKPTDKPISMSLSEIEKQISLLKNLSFKDK